MLVAPFPGKVGEVTACGMYGALRREGRKGEGMDRFQRVT